MKQMKQMKQMKRMKQWSKQTKEQRKEKRKEKRVGDTHYFRAFSKTKTVCQPQFMSLNGGFMRLPLMSRSKVE